MDGATIDDDPPEPEEPDEELEEEFDAVEFLHFVGLLVPFLPVYLENTEELILYQRECTLPLTLSA